MINFLKRYSATAIGAGAVLAAVATAGVYISRETVSNLVAGTAQERAQGFVRYLGETNGALDALLTGLSRDPDLETEVRAVALASGLENFTIFDIDGQPEFSLKSEAHAWLLRERPGGIRGMDSLAQSAVERPGEWTEVTRTETGGRLVISPLDKGGQRLAFVAVTPDMTGVEERYVTVIGLSIAGLIGVLVVAAGVPGLIYIRRKWRIEQADERIQFLANHDTLTKLLNRKRIEEDAGRILATCRATRERLAVWALDIEGLADINESVGQEGGDELLRTVADRLLSVIDRNDLVARTGADDFVIIQRNLQSINDIEALARRIRLEVETPVAIGGLTLQPRLCAGVSTVPEHGRTIVQLFQHAELALLVHKSSKRGDYVLFEPSMDEEASQRRMIERRMREALDQDQFELFYQPIVRATDKRILGFESLIRLPDGLGGYIPPSLFIPIAEARGYIKAIGDWVLREATRQIALWPDDLFISVNLSAVQFRDGDLVQIVKDALETSGIAGHRLEIEVVESLLLDRSDSVLTQLQELKTLGVSIAMDDFGTGYSSLGYLWRFPFDKLKIDQSFMIAFEQGESSIRQIIGTIVSLGHHMNLKVVTEGIETAEQAAMLQELGCDQLQGYLFGKPVAAERVAAEMMTSISLRASRLTAAAEPIGMDEPRLAAV
ncbi:bifunctional diguanylate cyclase/phosphodiesterase [Aureimonas sp. SK2]|uniref:putative bifunctional diguanylate cyclase/phosphodiesterase n=1 Tax=Aureimonas sp. SK2 TaxID=3015992 RepID=UPI002444AF9E|nr:bifunctional diguanylate cyclase/phosphodiesterase [Aureimonas sp. SK2]